MWLYILLAVLAVVATIGTVLFGGIFTIILVPLAVSAGLTSMFFIWLLEIRHPRPKKASRTTPEDLANARRDSV